MAQDICAKQEPPLLQIGKTHKVACHFAGEYGTTPTRPITLSALGVDQNGTPVSGVAPSTEDLNKAGYADTWTDLESHTAASGKLQGGAPSDDITHSNDGTDHSKPASEPPAS